MFGFKIMTYKKYNELCKLKDTTWSLLREKYNLCNILFAALYRISEMDDANAMKIVAKDGLQRYIMSKARW